MAAAISFTKSEILSSAIDVPPPPDSEEPGAVASVCFSFVSLASVFVASGVYLAAIRLSIFCFFSVSAAMLFLVFFFLLMEVAFSSVLFAAFIFLDNAFEADVSVLRVSCGLSSASFNIAKSSGFCSSSAS
jgi:hypothetical protein